MPLLLPALLLDIEPSWEGLRGIPAAAEGAGEGGGRGPPCPLAALAALLSDTLMGEMPSAQTTDAEVRRRICPAGRYILP